MPELSPPFMALRGPVWSCMLWKALASLAQCLSFLPPHPLWPYEFLYGPICCENLWHIRPIACPFSLPTLYGPTRSCMVLYVVESSGISGPMPVLSPSPPFMALRGPVRSYMLWKALASLAQCLSFLPPHPLWPYEVLYGPICCGKLWHLWPNACPFSLPTLYGPTRSCTVLYVVESSGISGPMP